MTSGWRSPGGRCNDRVFQACLVGWPRSRWPRAGRTPAVWRAGLKRRVAAAPGRCARSVSGGRHWADGNAVMVFEAAHERFGKLPFAAPFGSAIYFAEPSFEVLPMLEGMIELRRDVLSRRSGTKATCASHWQNTSGRMISDNARVVESECSGCCAGPRRWRSWACPPPRCGPATSSASTQCATVTG